MKRIDWHFLAVVVLCFVGMIAALSMLPSCATGPGSQTIEQSATNAYPHAVAALEGLRVVMEKSGGSVFTEAAVCMTTAAIAALGVWARVTNGRVLRTRDELAAIPKPNQPKKDPNT